MATRLCTMARPLAAGLRQVNRTIDLGTQILPSTKQNTSLESSRMSCSVITTSTYTMAAHENDSLKVTEPLMIDIR